MTVEDYQRGAMLEALHFLEIGLPMEAHKVLLAMLKQSDLKQPGPLLVAMQHAANWIEPLGNPDQAANELRQALALSSKPL